MIAMAVLKVGENRGAPRVWVSCENARRAGFEPGQRFVVQHSGKGLLIKLDTEGERVVSQKKRGERTVPVIDINSKETLSPVAGCEVVRVVFGKGQIYVSALASELRRQERLERVKRHVAQGGLSTGGIALGGGILTHAVHQGIKDAGLTPHALVANEIREELVDHALVHNDSLSQYTVVLNAPLQEVAFDDEVLKRLQPVDLVDCGIPCSGASVAGKARNKNAMMEDHEHVGHLIAAAIALLVKLNPVCIVWENVTQYSSTASAAILRKQLSELGYDVQERQFLGTDWGELEARQRWCLVAMTRGIEFDIERVTPPVFAQRKLSDVLDPVPEDDPSWSPMTYLKEKEVRDKAAGKGFRMQLFTGDENSIATLTKGMAKRRSTDPFIINRSNPELLRLPTVAEHARMKGVPEHLVADVGITLGHEILGQAVVYTPFRLIAKAAAEAIKRFAAGHEVAVPMAGFKAAA